MGRRRGRSGTWAVEQRQALGEQIRESRKTRYESQEAFATALEVAPPYISQIENGRRIPSDDLLCAMAKLLPGAADWNAIRIEAHRLRSSQDLATLISEPESVPEILHDRLFRKLRRELEGSDLPREQRDKLIEKWLGEIELFTDLLDERGATPRTRKHARVAKS